MKRVIYLIFLLISVSAYAQKQAKELINEMPSRVANFLHVYEAPEKIKDTPAPNGYKPFYVSHYGRHGSRFHAGYNAFNMVMPIYDTLYKLNLLTDEGKSIYEELKILKEAHDGVDGYLSLRGAAEHRGISDRLYKRYPEIFNQKDRNVIHCEATGVQRCIQSMANFCVQLKGNASNLRCDMLAGGRYGAYLCNSSGTSHAPSDKSDRIRDSIYNENFDYHRFMNAWFTDPLRAAHYFGFEPMYLMRVTIDAGAISECISEEVPQVKNFFRHFTQEELFAYWANNTAYKYNATCASLENDHSRYLIGIRILKDILVKADAAIAGNDVAANLRFGHDTGIAPLFALLQVEGLDKLYHMREVYKDHWITFKYVPMAANLQIIFYRNNTTGDVLVKLLRNEEETTIPALKTFTGPYYKWQDLRNYFLERIALIADN